MVVVISDLKNLINLYVECHSQLIPYYSFDQFVLKLEKVGTSRRVKQRPSLDTISSVFSAFGRVTGVHATDDTGARVIVCFSDTTAAQATYQAHNRKLCPQLCSRTLRMHFSLSLSCTLRYHPILLLWIVLGHHLVISELLSIIIS